jgi:hypothetical protein
MQKSRQAITNSSTSFEYIGFFALLMDFNLVYKLKTFQPLNQHKPEYFIQYRLVNRFTPFQPSPNCGKAPIWVEI